MKKTTSPLSVCIIRAARFSWHKAMRGSLMFESVNGLVPITPDSSYYGWLSDDGTYHACLAGCFSIVYMNLPPLTNTPEGAFLNALSTGTAEIVLLASGGSELASSILPFLPTDERFLLIDRYFPWTSCSNKNRNGEELQSENLLILDLMDHIIDAFSRLVRQHDGTLDFDYDLADSLLKF